MDGFWYSFLVSTGQKVVEFLALCHRVAVGIALVCSVVVAMIWAPFSTSGKVKGTVKVAASAFADQIGRMVLTHAMVLGVATLLLIRIDNSHWARHAQNGKLFQPFHDNADLERTLQDENYEPPPFTLPNRDDVLLMPQYKSPYLASYAKIMNYNQPGNHLWRSMVKNNSVGYSALTSGMQEELCETLVDDIMLREFQSRFLHQTEPGRWLELSGQESGFYCHKELMAESNLLGNVLLDEIEQLQTETKFGAWRSTAMHRYTIPGYLTQWMITILDHHQHHFGEKKKKQPIPTNMKKREPRGVSSSMMARRESLLSLPVLTVTAMSDFEEESNLPSPPQELREPYNGAWIRIGDVVEGKYQGIHNGK